MQALRGRIWKVWLYASNQGSPLEIKGRELWRLRLIAAAVDAAAVVVVVVAVVVMAVVGVADVADVADVAVGFGEEETWAATAISTRK